MGIRVPFVLLLRAERACVMTALLAVADLAKEVPRGKERG